MRRAARSLALAMLVTSFAACGGSSKPPLGEIILYLDTDAPLPAAPGDSLGPNDPPPLFDRVRIEIYAPGGAQPCDGCRHEFDVDRGIVAAKNASVGITTPPGASGYVARVRLFRGRFVELGEPRADATLESVVALPPTAAEGATSVTVLLHTDDVARPRGTLAAPIAAELRLPDGLAGTWSGAARRGCSSAPNPGEVCVPSGAYWMGNPETHVVFQTGDSTVMRLVSLSPFFLDAAETTVASFRAAGIASTTDPLQFNAKDPAYCTFTTSSSNNDELPVSCVSWDKARAYCNLRGGDLPSEAQYQYAASGLEGRLYVWGEDAPSCGDAVYARTISLPPDYKCPGAWSSPAGAGAKDRLVLPNGGVVVDLAGNVSERALDLWNALTESCWGTGVFRDPVCTTPSAEPGVSARHTVVGGSWLVGSTVLVASSRGPEFAFAMAQSMVNANGNPLSPNVANTGFRCARADTK
jgi:formylglycine-generating enzyme required for sulfatase activity